MAFGFVSKKEKINNVEKSETTKEEFTEAKEILTCPAEDEEGTILSDFYLKGLILGKTVTEGDIIIIGNKKRENNKKDSAPKFPFNDFFDIDLEEEFGLFREMKLKILKTEPKGKVKITSDTTVKQLGGIPNEDGIPRSNIVNVKKLPDFKQYIEVNDLKEIIKIAKAGGTNRFVNRFEDKRRVVYFVYEYYYVKKKQPR